MSAMLEAPTAAPSLGRRERLALEERLWRALSADPLVFLALCRTLDEHAPAGEPALRAFPVCAVCARDERANVAGRLREGVWVCGAHHRRHKPYVRPLVTQWLAEAIVLGEKSRQVLGSWLYVLLHGWLVLTRPGARVGVQSLNWDKACELIERFAVAYRSLPREAQRFGPFEDSPKARARSVQGEIVFRHEVDGRPVPSRLMALPNGPNQVRMYTFTALFQDEAQFWEPDLDFEESYAAALATVQGGGKLTAISSVNHAGTFHYRLYRGQV